MISDERPGGDLTTRAGRLPKHRWTRRKFVAGGRLRAGAGTGKVWGVVAQSGIFSLGEPRP